MRIVNTKFMISFPNLSAASCQVNFSRRLRYQNVKRRQTAAAYPAFMPCPAIGSPSGAGTRAGAGLRSGAGSWSCNPFESCNIRARVELEKEL